jgi:hypothetical protein
MWMLRWLWSIGLVAGPPLALALGVAPSAAWSQYHCPVDWRDAGTPIDDPQPIAPPGVPEAGIDGLHAFVTEAGIADLETLLGTLPDWLLDSHVLMESTQTTHPASVAHPRVLLFGSDARFLMAFGSDPADPAREVLDLAELRDDGHWKLRALDFGASPPALSPDDSACTSCHGDPPRPFWGSYPSWPGAFGAEQDLVTAAQATRLNEIRADPTASDRLFALDVPPPFGGGAWEAGDIIRLPGRAYPYTNTVFNLELGAAVADGAFRRLRAAPQFPELRDELLTLSYCALRDGAAYVASGARDAVAGTLGAAGVSPASRDALYRHLGVDPDQTFSLDRLAHEPPDASWNVSTDSLPGLVNLLLLHDWMREDPALLQLLEAQPDLPSPFNAGCFDHVADAIRHRIHLGWTLRGEARQASRAAGMDLDLLRATQGVLDPVQGALCPFLYERVQSAPPTPAAACGDGVDNDGDGYADFPADAGCASAASGVEDPPCDDGLDNDRDGHVDLDDPHCARASDAAEAPVTPTPGCGLGPELALGVPVLLWRWRRRKGTRGRVG